MSELYVGLMSGTSADGIDAALVDFSDTAPRLIDTHYVPYSDILREKILALCHEGIDELNRMGALDIMLGQAFAEAVNHLLKKQLLLPSAVKGIGSHGQTIRHYPDDPYPFTLQIADPNTIAALTGITTVADFRRKDLACGGQGAPLVPAFHQYIFGSEAVNRAIVNIGGIANVTLLPQGKKHSANLVGFDIGPGNTLLDAWVYAHRKELHDKNGAWGAQGKVLPKLLKNLLADKYFALKPPKSTGREYFNLAWLEKYLHAHAENSPAIDVQATLVELTAQTIINAVENHFSTAEILICGGGANNILLMSRLIQLAQPNFTIASTEKYGLHPDWIEAIAFAWLARQTLNRQPGNIPSVTGASKAAVLGGVYYGTHHS